MDPTTTAIGTWSGGRFMHFGEPLSEERFLKVIQHAWQRGIRTFMTADVYGNGAADEMLGPTLLSLHNIAFYLRLMADARRAITQQAFAAFHAACLARWSADT